MARSAYKKFLKQERSKVKLKNKAKTLLPKGQNVTDLNFKVKKIVIKNQLKEHEEDEVLSSRKLNIQEVLSRLGHYSGTVSTEAVVQLESLLKVGGQSFLSSHLTSIISQLGKQLTSPYSHLRKAVNKLLSSVLAKIAENEWEVVRGIVVSYIVCGLSHVDPGVRSDSLLSLDALPLSFLSSEILLPSLLDVMSTSQPAGSRALNTHLSSSPTHHRISVLSRIRSVLSSIETPQKVTHKVLGCVMNWKDGMDMRVPLVPSFAINEPLSISEFSSTTSLSKKLDLKEFASSLIPLMLDSFSEIAPPRDAEEPACILNQEGVRLLSTVADNMILLNGVISSRCNDDSSWMKDNYGNQFYKRVIENRFPYAEKIGKKQHNKVLKTVTHQIAQKLNLSLSFLTLNLAPPTTWVPVIHFLSDILRGNGAVDDMHLLERCLTLCFSQSSSKSITNIKTSLARINRFSPLYKEVFSVLSNLYLRDSSESKILTGWFENLISEMASPDQPLYHDSLHFLKAAAPVSKLPSNFDSAFANILEKSLRIGDEALFEVGNLLYWVEDWDPNLLNLLQLIIENHPCQESIKKHVINIIIYKCQRYPEKEFYKKLQQHAFWKKIIPTYCNYCDNM